VWNIKVKGYLAERELTAKDKRASQ